ncbi:DUF4129 domain-containing protein [Planctomycetes bacterium K23_9]|uniref:Uncharacterized protein n=1 Tax=Stieleria marina TaxID=1930275 RepID=A0A517NSW4_9BACT|nr:hypothetical protein K239x_21740 [Planctomycetes bacterium K23_9]
MNTFINTSAATAFAPSVIRALAILAVAHFSLAHFTLPVATAQQSASTAPATTHTTESSPTANALQSTPWFDADAGTLIPVTVNERIDDSVNRNSRWLPKPPKVAKKKKTTAKTTTTKGGTTGTGTGTGLFGSDLTLGNVFGWLLLALVIFAAVGGLVYAFSKTEIDLGKTKDAAKISTDAPDEQMIERMKHLPAELRRTDVNLRTESERLMNEGQFGQAIILLFGHQLLMLDQAGSLRLTRGKTNGRYVRETRSSDRESGERLGRTVTAFERSYFGRHGITQSEFASLWENNQALEQRLTSQQEVAA